VSKSANQEIVLAGIPYGLLFFGRTLVTELILRLQWPVGRPCQSIDRRDRGFTDAGFVRFHAEFAGRATFFSLGIF
jgi:hypothetical protein